MFFTPLRHFASIASLLMAVFFFTVGSSGADGGKQKLVVLGDSLSAGYRLQPGTGFPDQLQKALTAKGLAVEVTGAGVSGDTTSGGLARVDWSVPDGTDAVIVELGANDALRGIKAQLAEDNLDAIITRLKERNIKVLLAGMRAPPNMGAPYMEAFDGLYPRLAEKHQIILYPFFLDGVAAEPSLNLEDGIHPNQQGIAVIVERILPFVERLLQNPETATQ